MGTTQAHISGQGSSTIEEVAKQRTFHLKQRTNKHGEIVARKGGKTHQATLASAVVGVQNWPTANARDWKDHGPTQGNRTNPNLGTAVHRNGQAAPASSSSLGSRQGLWLTARSLDGQLGESLETWTARYHRKEAQGINLHRPLPIAVMQEQQKQWATPRACEAQNPPMGVDKRHHGLTHQVTKQWATPRSGKTTDENPETWALRQAKGDVATMPLTAQVKCWATPQAHDAQGPKTPEQIAVMRAKGHGVKNLNEQAQWGTPTARDHKSGRGNEEREYKELTPMVERQQSGKLNPRWVETLMGLPIGWTMPSCIRPVTIELMSCDYSGMALCRPAQSERSDFLLAS